MRAIRSANDPRGLSEAEEEPHAWANTESGPAPRPVASNLTEPLPVRGSERSETRKPHSARGHRGMARKSPRSPQSAGEYPARFRPHGNVETAARIAEMPCGNAYLHGNRAETTSGGPCGRLSWSRTWSLAGGRRLRAGAVYASHVRKPLPLLARPGRGPLTGVSPRCLTVELRFRYLASRDPRGRSQPA